MKDKISKIGYIVLGFIIIFVGFKGCLKTVMSFDTYTVYENRDSNNQINRVFIIPTNEIIFSKNLEGNFELALFHARGENITHYFGSIYNIGTFPFGIRSYPDAKEAWDVELELKDKYGNVTESTFDEIGEDFRVNLIFFPSSITIDNDNYTKIDFSIDEVKKLRKIFK